MNKTSFALKAAIPLAILSLQTQALHAADGVELTDSGLELTVTANRRLQPSDDSLPSVTVISKADIRKYQATNLQDVLKRVPGVSIRNQGGSGKLTSISLRGTNSGHVLVLIDGIKVGSATAGTTPFEHISLSQVERIEVLRGSRSSLYGSEALGGVIRIMTQKGKGKASAAEISVGLGSHNSKEGSVAISGSNDTTWFRIGASKEKTDGFNVQDSYTAFDPITFAPSQVTEPDNDGYSRENISFNLGHTTSNGMTAELSVLDSEGYTDYDGGFQNKSDFHERSVSGKLSGKISKNINLRATLGSSLDDLDSFKDNVFTTKFTTRRKTASLIADVNLSNESTLTLGHEYQKDDVSGSTAYSVTSRDNNGTFLGYQRLAGANNIEASIRSDDNEQFGKKTTGSIAYGREMANGITASTSFATAFKAPTFNDLYFPADPFYTGNPDLSPESSKTFEVGLSKRTSSYSWGVSAFKTDIDDLILFSSDPVTFVGTVKNLAEASITGLELELGTKLGGWNLNTNMTVLDAENGTGINKGNRLVYRPRRVATIDLDRSFGKFNIGSTLFASSKRYTNNGNTDSISGYATLDLRAGYKISKNWEVGAKIANLFDKEYETDNNYNQDGLNGMLTIRYSTK
ncbi:MAG: TonB-dependent receptor [Cocleimonas sp.]